MASPVSDDLACFDSLPDDLVGVIMGKLNLRDALRLTQACPTARRLVQGERAVPGVLGKVVIRLPGDCDNRELRVAVQDSGFWFHDIGYLRNTFNISGFEAATPGEDDAERQPSACIVHLFEWIRVRARAFTEITTVSFAPYSRSVLDHIADSFLPNVPSSYRGKISFEFVLDPNDLVDEDELEEIPPFLAAWRALAPAYECGLMLGGGRTIEYDDLSSELYLPSFQAAPPLSSLTIEAVVDGSSGFKKVLDSLDTSRLTKLHVPRLFLESLPSQDLFPPTLQDLSLGLSSGCLSGLGAFLAPLHRLTALELEFGYGDRKIDSLLTLAPFTVLPNLRLLEIVSWSESLLPPAKGSDYWKDPVVLPALEELYLSYFTESDAQGEEGEPATGQPSRCPTLLSNLEAPKLERLLYTFSTRGSDYDRTPDLPLGRFPRLRYLNVFASVKARLDLPALRAEIATLRHLERPRADDVTLSFSKIHFFAKDPVPEEEVKAWELELGFRCTCKSNVDVCGRLIKAANFKVELSSELFPS